MAKQSLALRLTRFLSPARHNHTKGFTLIELLIVTVIAAGIVSGLVYLVIQLLGADQRESARAETQREMQMAMDYISNEMREATYVYTGTCFDGSDVNCPRGAAGVPLTNFLPASLTNQSVPIVAFWRQYPLSSTMRNNVCNGSANAPAICLNANSYALVVYSLSRLDTNTVWKGRARITRYVLSQYDNAGTANPGYADPSITGFQSWPFLIRDGNAPANQQVGTPAGTPAALVDFVDDGTGAASSTPALTTNAACPDNPGTTATDYVLTPTTTQLNAAGFNNARTSFYACVSPITVGTNQDVILYVRGNARGRGGIPTDKTFLPTLETRVLIRGVLDRTPPS
ncbi:MAG TPA: prepilin-type N-terminal cleavage/methylation domain-containing protein [Crinalium sp.]|jgi:prepilin-type N-terminal cleavage/methylation domain-containing protein